MKIENITKSYGKRAVLRGISFDASSGECIGILGGNGSGKSTLLNILAGVIRSDSGSFSFRGNELLRNPVLRGSVVGYVPQGTPLFDELTAFDNLRLWYKKDEIERELNGGVLSMLGIGDFLKVSVGKMSGGMKKRLSIGCSVAGKPNILLLDEPSAALDLVAKESICEYIRDFKARGGIVVIATHDVGELPLCDRLFLLKDGGLLPYEFKGDVSDIVGRLK